MDHSLFVDNENLKLYERFYLFSIFQSKLFLNNIEERKPTDFEIFEAQILSSFISLKYVEIEYPELFKNLEKHTYKELRKINNQSIAEKLMNIEEAHSFINNRFSVYKNEIYQKNSTHISKFIIDKLYLNPISKSDEILLETNNMLQLLKYQSIFSIGYKYFTSSISETYLFMKKEENAKLEVNPYWEFLKDFKPLKPFDNHLAITKPILIDNSLRLPSQVRNKIFVNYTLEHSFYIKFLSFEKVILLKTYGYPMSENPDLWLTFDNSKSIIGQATIFKDFFFEIKFNTENQELFFNGNFRFNPTKFSGLFALKPTFAINAKEILDFKELNEF